jgi:hypothetical protein
MPLFCESRLPPFNIWSIEEKITWADHDIRFDEWTLKQTELLSKYWGGMMPGQGVYDRVLRKKKAGQELTEDKEEILEYSLEQSTDDWEDELQAELSKAHTWAEKHDVDPFDMDFREEDRLGSEAIKATAKSLEQWKAQQARRSRGAANELDLEAIQEVISIEDVEVIRGNKRANEGLSPLTTDTRLGGVKRARKEL